MKNRPRTLLLDIETAPILGYVWGLWDQQIGLNQIHSDWYILAWAAKWMGEKEVFYRDQRKAKNIENDKAILQDLWTLLDEADVIVTQNGKQFDEKKINARFIIHGFQPPSSYKHADTRSIARKKFGFTSNKLAYMTDKLCTKYKKLEHKKYPGFELWKECLAGNLEAWKEMEKYNRYDVLSLEELYTKLRPWDNCINPNLYHEGEVTKCACGSDQFKKRGFHYTAIGKFQRFKCLGCGQETRGGKNLFSKEKKEALRRVVK